MFKFCKKYALPIAIFILAFGLYIATLNPSIFPGDGTEFITVIATGGVAHPSGYPLFTLLGKIFALIPFLNFPIKINLLSVFAGASTVVLASLIIVTLTGSLSAGIFGALLLALSSPFWLYSVTAEVFTLHTFLISLWILSAIYFLKNPNEKKALFLIFLLALNASNHHTASLLLPILLSLLVSKRKQVKYSRFFLLKVAFISGAGLLPYFYVPMAAKMGPPINWDNAINIKNFLHLFLRKDFGTTLLAPGNLSFTPKTSALDFYLYSLWQNSYLLLPVFAGAGIFWLKKSKDYLILILGSFLLIGPFFMIISRLKIASINQEGAIERFALAPNLFLAILAGCGFAFIVSKLPKQLKISWSALIGALLVLIFLINFPVGNQRKNDFYLKYSEEILKNLPEGAVFITTGDTSDNGINYLTLVAKQRQDIKIITLPKTPGAWYREQLYKKYPELKGLISALPQETIDNLCKKFGADGKLYSGILPDILKPDNGNCTAMPSGLVLRLLLPDYTFDQESWKKDQEQYFNNLETLLLEKKRPKDLRTARIVYEMAGSADEVGNFLYWRGDTEAAEHFYSRAARISPHWFKSLDSLAVIAIKNNQFNKAIALEREAIKRNPNHPWAYYNLGILLKEYGDKKEAESMLYEFLSFKPNGAHQEVGMTKRALSEISNSQLPISK